MEIVVAVALFSVVVLGVFFLVVNYLLPQRVTKARRYAVTLKRNEGAFIALCIRKRWNYWTFEDVRVQPTNPGGAVVQAAPGSLHVPYRNILYYQEIVETANVAE